MCDNIYLNTQKYSNFLKNFVPAMAHRPLILLLCIISFVKGGYLVIEEYNNNINSCGSAYLSSVEILPLDKCLSFGTDDDYGIFSSNGNSLYEYECYDFVCST